MLNKKAFTLVELAIFLIISSLLTSGMYNANTVYIVSKRYDITTRNLEKIEKSLVKYVKKFGYLPCPASPTDALSANNFAKSATCSVASPTGLTLTNTSNNKNTVAIGVIPTRTLGLQDKYMTDGWGNRFTYAAIKELSQTKAKFDDYSPETNTEDGVIKILDSDGKQVTTESTDTVVPYIVLSHGRGKNGAYDRDGDLVSKCDTNREDGENCDNDSVFKDLHVGKGTFHNVTKWKTLVNLKEETKTTAKAATETSSSGKKTSQATGTGSYFLIIADKIQTDDYSSTNKTNVKLIYTHEWAHDFANEDSEYIDGGSSTLTNRGTEVANEAELFGISLGYHDTQPHGTTETNYLVVAPTRNGAEVGIKIKRTGAGTGYVFLDKPITYKAGDRFNVLTKESEKSVWGARCVAWFRNKSQGNSNDKFTIQFTIPAGFNKSSMFYDYRQPWEVSTGSGIPVLVKSKLENVSYQTSFINIITTFFDWTTQSNITNSRWEGDSNASSISITAYKNGLSPVAITTRFRNGTGSSPTFVAQTTNINHSYDIGDVFSVSRTGATARSGTTDTATPTAAPAITYTFAPN